MFIPVSEVSKHNRHLIDDQAILNTFKSQIKKFFNPGNESKTKLKRAELVDLIEDDQVMVRFEDVNDKQYDQQLVRPDQIRALVENNRKFTLHEVIYSQWNKLFFDIDKHELDLPRFKLKVAKILTNMDIDVSDL